MSNSFTFLHYIRIEEKRTTLLLSHCPCSADYLVQVFIQSPGRYLLRCKWSSMGRRGKLVSLPAFDWHTWYNLVWTWRDSCKTSSNQLKDRNCRCLLFVASYTTCSVWFKLKHQGDCRSRAVNRGGVSYSDRSRRHFTPQLALRPHV